MLFLKGKFKKKIPSNITGLNFRVHGVTITAKGRYIFLLQCPEIVFKQL